MKKIEAKIIADSIDVRGNRITSYILTYPRFIHAELMTHRMFSRNSASSRAIPFERMVQMVKEDPFIPIAWQKDHKGMQGTEYFEGDSIRYRRATWLRARDRAIEEASRLSSTQEVTKQLANRLLEPFMWYTVLVTATEYDNFFELRCPKYHYLGEDFRSKRDAISAYSFESGFEKERKYLQSLTDLDWIKMSKSAAEIHIQALAEAMWDAKNESTPKQLKGGEWHIPFGDSFDWDEILKTSVPTEDPNLLIKVAVARCARLSYMTFDGEIDYEKDIKLHDQLLKSGHMSPFEHCAKVMDDIEYKNFKKTYMYQTESYTSKYGEQKGWCNNFRGFIPYRYLIENESKF